MAPEVLDARISLQDIQAFKQIDIYALALVMWEVVWRCNVQQGERRKKERGGGESLLLIMIN